MKAETDQVASLTSLGDLSDKTVDKFFSDTRLLNKIIKAGS